jgi:hypothetical protein
VLLSPLLSGCRSFGFLAPVSSSIPLRFDTAESEGEDEDEGEGDATPGTSRVGRLVNRELPRSKD